MTIKGRTISSFHTLRFMRSLPTLSRRCLRSLRSAAPPCRPRHSFHDPRPQAMAWRAITLCDLKMKLRCQRRYTRRAASSQTTKSTGADLMQVAGLVLMLCGQVPDRKGAAQRMQGAS